MQVIFNILITHGTCQCLTEKTGSLLVGVNSTYHMAGNFGGLLKFLYLSEFTLVVWSSLCHNDIHSKMANLDEQSKIAEESLRSTCAVV